MCIYIYIYISLSLSPVGDDVTDPSEQGGDELIDLVAVSGESCLHFAAVNSKPHVPLFVFVRTLDPGPRRPSVD